MNKLIILFSLVITLLSPIIIAAEQEPVSVRLFYSPGCRDCRKIKDQFLVSLGEKYPGQIQIEQYDISIEDNYLKLMEFEELYKVQESDPIIIFAGQRYFSGKQDILDNLAHYLETLIEQNRRVETIFPRQLTGRDKLLTRFKSFHPWLIISAGLIDGINPCAFVTIIFLISFLMLAGRNKKEILLVGLVFSLAVFLTYLLLGLGLYQLLQKLAPFRLVSDLIYFLAIAIVFILAFFSFYDALIYLKSRNTTNLKLQLPQTIKKRIHDIIRTNLKTRGLLLTVLVVGILVSLLESVCTGQVYFPTLVYIAKQSSLRTRALFYLLLYNLFFITPLIVIIILTFLGLSLEKLKTFSRYNTFIIKLLLGLLFLTMGTLLVIYW